MSSIIEVNGLCKTLGHNNIVNNISFQVQKGDVLGFLGPNGAGKSTTIKMMLGLVKPTKGEVKLDGYDILNEREAALSKVGAMVEATAFYGYMTGYQNLKLYARLYDVGESRINQVLELVHLLEDKDKKVKKYSLGMKQRLGIARAFLNSPEIIILDEPTNGLDPIGIIEIRQIIMNLAEKSNITFIICSHILGEIEAMCNKLLIINKGNVISNGTVEQLLQMSASSSLEEFYINTLKENQYV